MDQTPLPFEFLEKHTYAHKGEKTIWIKSDHTNWTKRQATLMITICADGISRCLPILIFRGKAYLDSEQEKKPRQIERLKYHSGVHVIFNSKAYSNEAITIDWIKTNICSSDDIQPERLMILDVFTGQTTDQVKDLMTDQRITPVYIPEGCTGYVQPLDTHINKLLKEKIAIYLDDLLGEEVLQPVNNESIGQRRVAITQAVGQAWEWLH